MKIDLLEPVRMVEYIDSRQIDVITLIKRYNEQRGKYNKLYLNDGIKHEEMIKFLKAHSVFIDLIKERAERQ